MKVYLRLNLQVYGSREPLFDFHYFFVLFFVLFYSFNKRNNWQNFKKNLNKTLSNMRGCLELDSSSWTGDCLLTKWKGKRSAVITGRSKLLLLVETKELPNFCPIYPRQVTAWNNFYEWQKSLMSHFDFLCTNDVKLISK